MSIKENFKTIFLNWVRDIFTVKLIKICFIVWMVLWVVFFFRENKDGEYQDFSKLWGKNIEEKRSYLVGDDLYEFIIFAQNYLPEGASYRLEGLPEFSIKEVRSMYYLVPLKAQESGYDHILVFGKKGYTEEGFVRVAEHSEDKYILRKVSWN